MMWHKASSWSPVELEYLKLHKDDPIDQLCIAVNKSRSAIKKQLTAFRKGLFYALPEPKKSGQRFPMSKKEKIDGIFMRSQWERNIYIIIKQTDQFGDVKYVEYEPTIFSFAPFGILKGTVSYTPDFKVWMKDGSYIWVEVKGYLKPQDKVRTRRFKKFYPEEFERLIVVAGSKSTKAYQFFEQTGVKQVMEYQWLKTKWKKILPSGKA